MQYLNKYRCTVCHHKWKDIDDDPEEYDSDCPNCHGRLAVILVTSSKELASEEDWLRHQLIATMSMYKGKEGCEIRSAFRDMLTEAMHIADLLDLDFEETADTAGHVYMEELELAKETKT